MGAFASHGGAIAIASHASSFVGTFGSVLPENRDILLQALAACAANGGARSIAPAVLRSRLAVEGLVDGLRLMDRNQTFLIMQGIQGIVSVSTDGARYAERKRHLRLMALAS